jgi:hypothetical protein
VIWSSSIGICSSNLAERLLNELFEDLVRLEKRIAEVTREIEALAATTRRPVG